MSEVNNMRERQVIWIPAEIKLPDLLENVLIYRQGGKNKDHVAFGFRRHKSQTRADWEWFETSGFPYEYFGIAVDGSKVTHWAHLPIFI